MPKAKSIKPDLASEPVNDPSKSVSQGTTATVSKTRQEIEIIKDPQGVTLAVNGRLDHNGRRLLVVRGGPDSCLTISQVYHRFSLEKDDTGAPFRVSRKLRGLTHIDPVWKSVKRITGKEFLAYLARWFCPAQMVANSDGPALMLLDEVPHYSALKRSNPATYPFLPQCSGIS
jgi:hypothetical protein